ncbi:SDR family NAD(P)-dependent oxidoreductase, partial [Myxococcota bacterium]|nr:SDR family NAD(P)-dependent oxidoreductase [Myxococcota bacterium]
MPAIDVAAIEARCTQASSGADYYRELEARGARLGPLFQRITSIRRADGEALARVAIAPDADAASAATCALDTALHLFFAALPDAQRPESGGFLPVAFESVELVGPAASTAFAHVSISTIEGGSLLCDAGLYDASGAPLVVFRGARYLRVGAETVIARARKIARDDVYAISWLAREVVPPTKLSPERWLVLAGLDAAAATAARRVVEALGELGAHAELVRTLDAQALTAGTIAGVVDLSLVSQRTSVPALGAQLVALDGMTVDHAITRDALGLVERARVLAQHARPLRWLVVTAGARAIDGAAGDPHAAAITALAKVISLEHPTLTVTSLDVDAPMPSSGFLPAAALDAITTELARGAPELLVASRAGHRTVGRLVHTSTNIDVSHPLPDDGVYVITGGLGALGLATARHLVARGARDLVLLSRSLANADAARTALEALGARVEVHAVDVADHAALAATLAGLTRADGSRPIRGVVHAAGVLDDALLAHVTPERFAAVTRAKIAGAWNLHTLTRGAPLEL